MSKNSLNKKTHGSITDVEIPTPLKNVEAINHRSLVSYVELAEQVGFCPPELLVGLLTNVIKQHDISLYKYEDMMPWLIKKRKEANTDRWYWRPLRKRDEINCSWNEGKDGEYNSEKCYCDPYDKLIPQHALEKVKLIEDIFGDQVSFFVSDYAEDIPDPFIMVRPSNRSLPGITKDYILIFDFWDEPGFGL